METLFLITKIYLIVFFLTTITVAWSLLDVERAIEYPQGILEDIFLGALVGLFWPLTVPIYIYVRVAIICHRLFKKTEEE